MRIGISFHARDRYISGVEYYCLGLLDALLGIDPDNEYVVWTNQPCLLMAHVRKTANLKVIDLSHLNTRILRALWEQTQLPRAAARQGLHVLHCPSYICPAVAGGLPYVATVHDTIALDHPEWCTRMNAINFRLFLKRTASRAARLICVSQCTADDLIRHFQLDPRGIRVVHPGVEGIFVPERNAASEQAVREKYRLPERYILYTGNVEPKKNVMVLLYVAQRLHRSGLPYTLVVTGRRAWRSKMALRALAQAEAMKVAHRTGYVERADLPDVYRMAHVLLFPSLYEGFGFPVLEAMACGLPVVASCRGALRETAGDAAILTEPGDVESLTRAAVALLTDASLRSQQVERGIRQSSRFQWSDAARETLAVYREAVAAHGDGPR